MPIAQNEALKVPPGSDRFDSTHGLPFATGASLDGSDSLVWTQLVKGRLRAVTVDFEALDVIPPEPNGKFRAVAAN